MLGIAGLQCSHCLYDTRHPLGLTLKEGGECSGCWTHREKFKPGWEDRAGILARLIASRASKAVTRHECVVPVRATPEYFYLLKFLTEDYGFSPLLTFYNPQLNSEVGIKNLARMVEYFDLDMIETVTDPRVYKDMVRHSIYRLGSVRWPALAGEATFAFKVAARRGIPTILWPHHDSVEQVGAHSYFEAAEFSEPTWTSFDLMGFSRKRFFYPGASLPDIAAAEFSLPDGDDDVIGLYAANFLPWDSRRYSETAVTELGALSSEMPRTFDTYDKVDDISYMRFHDLLKQAKYGYGRVRDSLVREIRFDRISREDALRVEALYSAESIPDEDLEGFAEWLGSDVGGLRWLLGFWRGRPGEFLSDYEIKDSVKADPLPPQAKQFLAEFINSSGATLGTEPTLVGKGMEIDD